MFLKFLSGQRKIFFIFAALFLTFLLVSPALADSANYYKPLVQIPGMPTGDVSLTAYLSTLFNFLISIVGILAMAVIIYGGMRYMVSAGNPAAMEDAKETIMSAVYGLALALGSWLIINVVNPDILVLKNPGVGLPGGKYSYNQTANNCVASPLGDGTAANPCKCIDGTTVTFTQPTGPFVASSDIPSCKTGVLVATPSITITFNEPVNISAGAVTLSPNTFASPTPTWTQSWTDGTLTSGNNITLTFTATGLSNTTTYALKIDASKTKDSAGVNMAANYTLDFTTRDSFWPLSCTPYSPPATDCNQACSNPATLGLTPPGAHCIKADLRVGDNLNNMVSDKISINAGQKLYFDMSNSKDYSGNPIARYEISWNGASLLGGVIGSFDCCPQGTGFLGTGATACWGWPALCPISSYCNQDLVTDHTYTTAGKYTVSYTVYNNNCAYATNPTAITVDVK